MPRRARMYLPGYPYHIVQRGNNREACFVEAENYQYYLELWKECSKRYSVGDDRFRKKIEERYGIKPGQLHRGRPRKQMG